MPTMRPMLSSPSVRLLRALACVTLLVAPVPRPRSIGGLDGRRLQFLGAERRHRRRWRRRLLRDDFLGVDDHGRAHLPRVDGRHAGEDDLPVVEHRGLRAVGGPAGRQRRGALRHDVAGRGRHRAEHGRYGVQHQDGRQRLHDPAQVRARDGLERQPEPDQPGRSVSGDRADRGQRRLPVRRDARRRSRTGRVPSSRSRATARRSRCCIRSAPSRRMPTLPSPINLDGAAPLGVLLQGADGFLYGTTSVGGVNGRGTIFRVGTDGSGFQLQHVFAALPDSGSPQVNVGGASPLAGLTDGKDGRFYGVASGGGTNGVGTIFAFDPVGRLFSVMHNFEDSNGDTPAGAMILGLDTRLYGTTAFGGTTSNGSQVDARHDLLDRARRHGLHQAAQLRRPAGRQSAGPAAADERHDADRRCARWRPVRPGHDLPVQFDRCHGRGRHRMRPEEEQQGRRRHDARAVAAARHAWACAREAQEMTLA